MARTVLSLALLACLGLAILHLVSAQEQEQNQELEDKAINNAAIQINPEEHQIRILREANAKKEDSKQGKGSKSKKGRKQKGKRKVGRSKNSNGKTRRVGKKGKGGKGGKRKPNKLNGKKRNGGKKTSRRTKKCGEKCKNRSGRKGGNGGRIKKCGKKCKNRSGRKGGNGGGTKKCRNGIKNGKCKNRSGSKGGKNGGKGGKNGRKGSKNGRNGGKKSKKGSKNPNGLPQGRQTCDVEALCQKIKNYIKYSNQLRKLRRINKTCSTMEKKRDKASAGEFTASGTANDDSDNTTVQAIADKLKNCTTSAKEKCETKAITGCTNTALNAKCEVELDAWIKKFGPAQGSCLQASASCCACINAITPDPSADCLEFEPLDKASKDKKKECTGSGTDGSFGHCRKLQMQAAEKGPQAHKEKCKDDNKVTTAKPSGRRMIFRNKLMKKFVKS